MFAEGARADWLNAIAAQIMDGGAMPPSIDRLYITVPPKIMTRESDGHCTAAAAFGEDRRKDKEAGWRVIIEEMVTILREQGFVGGSDQGLTWIKAVDGEWKVSLPEGKQFTQISVFGQKERRDARDRLIIGERSEYDSTGITRVGTPSLFETGKMHPFELQVEGPRGNIKIQKFEIHPLANLMPSYTQAEREGLRNSIQRDGVKVPVVIYQKKLLDGRNRAYFAQQFKKSVRIIEFTGTEEEAKRLVITLNLVRRHLTPAQQDLLANQLFSDEARKEAAQKRIRQPRKKPILSVENFNGQNEPKEERWDDIAARKAKEVGITAATSDGIRAMELVKDAPDTMAKVVSGEIKNPSKAARKAREEKGMPKATTFEGARTRSLTKHTGEIHYHYKSMLTDLEMPVGSMPEKLSERLDENDRLNAQLRQALRDRKVIP